MHRRFPILPLVLLFSGCTAFHPEPISPSRVTGALQARTLSDPGLQAYVETHRHTPLSAWPPPAWDLETLTLAAFYYHPDLDVARARLDVARAGIVTAGGRPNPDVSIKPGYSDSPDASWVWEQLFNLPLETAGKRGLRIARAAHLTEAARLALAERGWQVRSRLRGALVEYLLARRDLELLRDEEEVQARAVALMAQRRAAGAVSRPDVDAAGIELIRLKTTRRDAQGRIDEGRVGLATALGLPAAALDGINVVWPGLDAPPAGEALATAAIRRAGLLNRLDVRRMLAEYAATENALQLEVAKQYPDVRLGPGYQFEDGSNRFVFGFSMKLPLFNRNTGPIAEAEARRREAAARFTARQAVILGDIDRALARYRAALAERAEADTLVARLDTRVRMMQRAVTLGEADRLTLVGIRLQRVVAARTGLEALRKSQAALGALEDAVQRPLDAEALPPEPSPSNPREGRPEGGSR